MTFRPTANYTRKKVNLLPHKYLVFVVVCFLLVVGFFFMNPKSYYQAYFKKQHRVSETSLTYLKQLGAMHQGDLELQATTIKHKIQMGKLKEAQVDMKAFRKTFESNPGIEEADWLQYVIDRELFYQLTPKDKRYVAKRDQLSKAIEDLLQYSNSQAEYGQLAQDAEALDNLALANRCYQVLLKHYPDPNVPYLAGIAKLDWSRGEYKASSKYFLKALDKSESNEAKLHFFQLAIKVLEARGDSQLAFKTALAQRHKLEVDRNLNVFLAKLALRANKLQEANKFIYQAVIKK